MLGYSTNEAMLKAFKAEEAVTMIKSALEKDPAKTSEESYIEIYKRLRDGDLATPENAKEFITGIFSIERYDLSPVGRFRFNKRFEMSMDDKDLERRTISKEDLVSIVEHIVGLNMNPDGEADDIDHLGQRRVRYVGELLQQKSASV